VADRPALERAIGAAAASLGGIDVLVTNAGAAAYGRSADVPSADHERTVAVTFGGAVDTVRAALPHLRRSRGVIRRRPPP
jgi:2-dehydro-3-deoxy-L-rhamnonate dehydrogenase (NAD+)